jgi:hypothetical protein
MRHICSSGETLADVIRSRPLYNSDEFGGHGGNWVDVSAGQGTGTVSVEPIRHLAKVGVAGSNPVFSSKVPGQRHLMENPSDVSES